IQAADQSGAVDFTQYDLVVVFHAGVGRDVELGYDPTPQDIPSLYLSKSFLQNALGPAFDGVPVNNGQTKIFNGILLPETQNQEGYQIALNGFLVSNIGSYLGLYDLFSPGTQKSGIGRFGLMDAGLLNANGLIPAPPSAFSRVLLGWEKPVDLMAPADDLQIARLFSAEADSLPAVYRVWLNQDEYYLIECRGDPMVNIDSLYEELAYNRDTLPSYMELLKTHFANRIEIGPSGVLTSVENYDWGLPGSGILIWHIDERVIREKGAQNRINDDPDWRAVDLEEADGSQDIGRSYSLLDAGYGKDLGWFADFWFKDRPDYLKDFELYKNEFSSYSRPATISNWNHAYSHIKLYDFSENKGDVMSFSFGREIVEKPFPFSLFTNGQKTLITDWLLAKYDRYNHLYFGRDDGQLGVLVFDPSQSEPIIYPGIRFDGNYGPIKYLNAMDLNQDGFLENIVITYPEVLVIYPNVPPASSAPISYQIWQAPDTLVSRPVINGNQILISCANDSLYHFSLEGTELKLIERKKGFGRYRTLVFSKKFDLPLEQEADYVVQGTNSDGTDFLVLARKDFSDQTARTFFTEKINGNTYHYDLNVLPVGGFALSDMDGNGTVDIVFNTEKQIWAINSNGTLINNFPISVTFDTPDQLIGTPIIADLDGEGLPEIIVGTHKGGLLGFDARGMRLPDFPLSLGGTLTLSPGLVGWDDDQPVELLALNQEGLICVWQLDLNGAPNLIWPLSQKNVQGNAALSLEGAAPIKQFTDLLPAGRVFNYPNPNQGNTTTIRFYLTEPAHVMIRIFDLAGERVLGVDMPGKGQTDNEFVWNVSDVAAGVYLCQVEAKGLKSGATQRRLFKIMVVH
ncbi:MAG: T9SS type A sorting domain-containing protein, partial [Caldisericaceae bacterium]|nr:T9SS type A sorting domain-containing protein [Caldisericaceae bacterium]